MLWTAGCGWGAGGQGDGAHPGANSSTKASQASQTWDKGNEVRIPLGPIATAELSWVELCPQERYVNILTLNLMHVTLF